ncbi:MAG TPA: hypothetical protein PK351_07840, partial [Spirochaetota bacterium]|nr:hypothetical protein [Spirochaetota bacterium]
VYNELKLVHDHINSFSIAILIRELLELYFAGMEVEGEEEFSKRIDEWQKEIETLREAKAVVVKIGSPDIPVQNADDDYFLLKFNTKFCLKDIKFL